MLEAGALTASPIFLSDIMLCNFVSVVFKSISSFAFFFVKNNTFAYFCQ